jgi:hypothetical protein
VAAVGGEMDLRRAVLAVVHGVTVCTGPGNYRVSQERPAKAKSGREQKRQPKVLDFLVYSHVFPPRKSMKKILVSYYFISSLC